MQVLSLAALVLFAAQGHAFPSLEHLARLAESQLDAGTQEELRARSAALEQPVQRDAITNFSAQPISVSGVHAFVPPGAGDVRGPCPGLNVLANHGYLPHNGVASLLQYATAVQDVFNMQIDLGLLLANIGTAFAGNLVSLNPSFSMGGSTPNSQGLLGNLGGLLAQPVGLDGTHGQYENDASATRGDMYVTGNNADLELSSFLDLYNLQVNATDPNYSMDVILQHNVNRYNRSLNTNPYFWYGPLTGTVLRNAAYCFISRLYSNYTADYPNGKLSKETLKSFFGVTGPEGSFVAQPGQERIPPNWYKRPTGYGIAEVSLDLTIWGAQYPFLTSAGGNTGRVNSFVGIDVNNITGGVLNAKNLLQSNNLVCLALEVLIEASPALLHSVYATVTAPLSVITNLVGASVLSLNCPQLTTATGGGTDLLKSWKNIYPGASKAGGAI
ncbi:hypothetical protein BP6252_13851 [Coleophoma cylindrospora]|uniref:Heme haloperoxidase family profile domain-containing protein n=1 Tax=Coleophoma cylindrospora TaxID=1849047 RepID=A0A3D8Q5I5_9HELO|nr:hypothetical protein BP6252_13851 [Coleophoma cylindrospora]